MIDKKDYTLLISAHDMYTLINSALTRSQIKYSAKEYYEARESVGRSIQLLEILKNKLYDIDELVRVKLGDK